MSLAGIFGTTGHVGWAQECARAVVILVYGLAVVRIAGRRLFARWSALDIVVAIVTGSNLSRALTGSADLFGTMAATTLLIGLHWALSHACARSTALSALLEGRSIRLGEHGRVHEGQLVRHAVSTTALEEALRGAGVSSAEETTMVVLEPSGKISALKKR